MWTVLEDNESHNMLFTRVNAWNLKFDANMKQVANNFFKVCRINFP